MKPRKAMRALTTCVLISIALISSAFAQQDSFLTLRKKFSGHKDVFCFGTSGFLARSVLWMAGEHEFTEAVRDIRSIRLITIPKSAFRAEHVSVGGFKSLLRKDSFEELARVREHGDDVSMYVKSTQHRDNRYIIIVEEPHNVVVIEIQGYVDPDIILNHGNLSFNNY